MRIGDAKKLYTTQMDSLQNKRRELKQAYDEGMAQGGNFDRVELSRELSQVEEDYERNRLVMAQISAAEAGLRDMAAAKQQSDLTTKATDDMLKCLEIARRISTGGKVPPKDEKKLMDYNMELYMSAKSLALAIKQKEHKEYKSLWADEEGEGGAEMSVDDTVSGAEVAVEAPAVSEAENSVAE